MRAENTMKADANSFVRRMKKGCYARSLATCLVSFCLGSALLFGATGVQARTRIALKSGESAELQLVYLVVNCASIVVGTPEVEILEGPEELTLEIKKGNVIPRAQNCAKPVPGGTLVVTAKEVTERKDAKLTYRVKYKSKQGDRQVGGVYRVSLLP
jgi:hypothetical protein